MNPPAHQILNFADQRTPTDAHFAIADTRCHMHSLLGWEWQANMSIPQAVAADHLLIHIKSGALEAEIDGTRYSAKRNQCLWIPKYAQRSLRAHSKSIFIAAHLDIPHSHYKRLSLHEAVSDVQDTQYRLLEQTIAQYSDYPPELFQIASVLYHSVILQMLLNKQISFQAHSYQDERVLQSINALQDDPTLSVEACARLQGLGVTRFRQRFHAATGMSPGNYITQFRCKRAAQLLRDTDHAIADISRACGYENPNYLYRVFKQQYHCTPNEFRAGLRNSV